MQRTKLSVRGMTCGSCARRVEHALRAVDGVSGVEVDVRAGVAWAKHEAEISAEELTTCVAEAGYEASVAG